MDISAAEIETGSVSLPESVEIGKCHMATYAVTREMYGLFMRETGQEKPKPGSSNGLDYPKFIGGKKPVVNVSQIEAAEFCRWMSGKTGKKNPTSEVRGTK